MKPISKIIPLILLFLPLSLGAQDSTAVAKKPRLINDYSLIGVNYGVTFANTWFSPAKHNSEYVFTTNYVSVTYTKFSKLFDRMPYFALVLGAAMGNEGYAFKADKETGVSADVDGATRCSIQVIDFPAMMQFHYDFEPAKVMANAGVYGGWRKSVTRSGPALEPEWTDKFRSYEQRFDYGFQGGAGFALIFDPVEIHFNCLLRWSWSNLYEPDYKSKYYNNYAYPLDIMATVGLHFQLSKRRGKTRKEIKQEAYNIVYGQTQDDTGQDR